MKNNRRKNPSVVLPALRSTCGLRQVPVPQPCTSVTRLPALCCEHRQPCPERCLAESPAPGTAPPPGQAAAPRGTTRAPPHAVTHGHPPARRHPDTTHPDGHGGLPEVYSVRSSSLQVLTITRYERALSLQQPPSPSPRPRGTAASPVPGGCSDDAWLPVQREREPWGHPATAPSRSLPAAVASQPRPLSPPQSVNTGRTRWEGQAQPRP